jgi:hypothetical protein
VRSFVADRLSLAEHFCEDENQESASQASPEKKVDKGISGCGDDGSSDESNHRFAPKRGDLAALTQKFAAGAVPVVFCRNCRLRVTAGIIITGFGADICVLYMANDANMRDGTDFANGRRFLSSAPTSEAASRKMPSILSKKSALHIRWSLKAECKNAATLSLCIHKITAPGRQRINGHSS